MEGGGGETQADYSSEEEGEGVGPDKGGCTMVVRASIVVALRFV